MKSKQKNIEPFNFIKNISVCNQLIKALLLVGFIITPLFQYAQVSKYTFSHDLSAPWQRSGQSVFIERDFFNRPNQGAITINNGVEEDTAKVKGPGFPIGFDFYYDGQYFDRFAASANGYIKLGHSSEDFIIKRDTLLGAVFGNGFEEERRNVIAAFQTDARTQIPFFNTLQYTEGLGFPGEQELVVSWFYNYHSDFYPEFNSGIWNAAAQIRLSQKDGSIAMTYYNPGSFPLTEVFNQVAVGLRGNQLNNSPENLHLRTVQNGLNNWATSQKSTNPNAVMDFNKDLIAITRSGDPNARTFSFAPPVDSSALPHCPTPYVLVPKFYPEAQYGDEDNYYVLLDNAQNIRKNPRIGWGGAGLLNNTYDVYLSTDNPPTERIATGLSENRLELPTLANNTTYYLAIVAKNPNGETSPCVVSFSTGTEQAYCGPFDPTGGSVLTQQIQFNDLLYNRTPEVENIVELPQTAPYTTSLNRKETYDFRYSLSATAFNRANVFVFIDFNQDGILSATKSSNDPEAFSVGLVPEGGTGVAQITIPNDAITGPTRMRIIVIPTNFFSTPQWDPCVTRAYQQNFTVTISPAEECQSFSINPQVTALSCFEAADGTLDLGITGASGPITTRWEKDGQPMGLQGTQVNQLTRGTYQAFVEDGSGCKLQSELIPITQPQELTLQNPPSDSLICADSENGALTINPQGGTAPYEYLWSNGQQSKIAQGLTEGQYSVTVTDDNGCQTTMEALSVFAPEPINVITENSDALLLDCSDSKNGTLTASALGGKAPYTYLWSDGQQSSTAQGLAEGQYRVTVMDNNGCEATSSTINITAPAPLQLALISESPATAGDLLEIQASGGTIPYTYVWNNGIEGPTLDNAPAGEFTASVTDKNGCVFSLENIKVGTTVGLDNPNTKVMSVYPNPATWYVQITLPPSNPQEWTIVIMNTKGKPIKQVYVNNPGTAVRVPVSGIASGNYLINASNGKRNITQQLMIE